MANPIVIAHRGASSVAPENTMLSYQKALELGADMIELDVQLSQDGYFVCIHDYELDRTTNGTGLVSDLTLDEIQSFDAGGGQIVPLLEDVLEVCKGRIAVNIELKIPDIEVDLVKLVKSKGMMNSVLFSSFLHNSLHHIVDLDSSSKTGILFASPIDDVCEYALSIKASTINPNHELISKNMISSARKRGLKIYPWTVNSESRIMDLINCGVDGIISDHPDIVKRLIQI